MKLAALFFSALLVPVTAAAQEPQAPAADSETVENLPVPSWGKAILDSFSKPLHPVIGGVATNGGVGVGVGYDSPDDQRWYQDGRAMFTVRRFWLLEGEVGRRSLSNRAQFGGFGAVRHMGRLDYFGIGPDTDLDDRAAFRLRETTFGARGWFRPMPAVRLGGTVSAYLPDVGRTNSSRIRPIESVFPDVPGLLSEPTFGRYRGFVELRHPAPVADGIEATNRYRGAYQLAFESVRDYSTGRHNLYRWEFETQQRLPGFRPEQRLTLHGFFATTNKTADVPFYLLYSLGGTGGLKTFRPDMLGGDGTRATLRGYRNFRFRDRDLVLMQAEYRIPIHKYVETSVFVDAGQVAPRPSELFSNIRGNTGFSVSAVRKGKTLGRLDVGFGGGEGVYFYWSFGAFQE
jgi:Omp85 superfamily domain